VATDGYATEDDVAETRHWDATGPRAEREAQDVIEYGDVFGRGRPFEGVDEVFAERVGRGPAPGEEFKGGVDGVEFIPGVANELAGVHSVKEGGLGRGVV